MQHTVKAAGDWELDILAVPFGGPDNLDADGEWFDEETDLHQDRHPLPPLVYYHGYNPDGTPAGDPVYVGKTTRSWVDKAGVWVRGVLDKSVALAATVYSAAQQGIARASSGSVRHLSRKDDNGHIRHWPLVEVSVFDAIGDRQPANRYAVALPVAKALWNAAGLDWPEAQAEAEQSAPGAESESQAVENTLSIGDKKMEAEQINEAVALALAAYEERQAAKAAAKAADEARIAEAVKAERTKWEQEAAVANRLPTGAGAPMLKHNRRYHSISPSEHALMVNVLRSAKAQVSDECLQALAARLDGEDGKIDYAVYGAEALKGMGLKVNEVHYSTLASHGDEWVGVLYSSDLWQSIRQENWVLNRLLGPGGARVKEVPQGFESDTIPLESTDPTWYKVGQVADLTSNRPAATITASQITTGQKSITLGKVGCNSFYSGEMEEDSLIVFMGQLRSQIVASGAEVMEHLVIDGDTDATISTNINDIDGTPAATDVFLTIDGFRKLALVTNTANSRSAGTLTEDDYLETVKLLGAAGMNALDRTKVSFIIDANTYWKTLTLASVKTKDVWENATLSSGELTGLWGYGLKAAAQMHRESAKRMAEATGKIDQTDSDNTTGSILAVRWDQWAWAWKRMMTIKTDEVIDSDAKQIVAMARFGMAYRDTEACAISYNVTV